MYTENMYIENTIYLYRHTGNICRERERERSLLTIKKLLKVGKHNALSGHTASGRSGSSM
jgi:hypothetical protein